MILRFIKRFKYYLILALKKPNLILSFIYKKHLGIILLVPLEKSEKVAKKESGLEIVKTNDIEEIYKFYKRMNRASVSRNQITEWLKNKFDCFLVYSAQGTVVGGMWIFKKKLSLKNTSGRTLSSRDIIYLSDESIYGAYVIIDEVFRGRGINQLLLRFVIDYYNNNSQYKKLLLITGASNGAYIRTTMKNSAKLIGITEITNFIGHKRRKELFLDQKEKVWSNTENDF